MVLNIVYSSNDNYARHMAASMVSVFENNKAEEKIDVYILNIGLSANNLKILSDLAKKYNRAIHIVDLSDIKKRFNNVDVPVRTFSIETFARLFLAEVLPKTEDRALWIDCDTAVIDNIHDLYYCDLKNYAAAAVADQPNFGIKILCDDAEITDDIYFNAGILLANLDVWRKEQMAQKFVDYFLGTEETVAFLDQAVLNHVLCGRIKKLPLKFGIVTPSLFLSYDKMLSKWGSQIYSKEEYISARKKPAIIHYTNFRPWKKWCLHPLKKHYRKYVKMTPYKDVPLEDDGLKAVTDKLLSSLKAKIKL